MAYQRLIPAYYIINLLKCLKKYSVLKFKLSKTRKFYSYLSDSVTLNYLAVLKLLIVSLYAQIFLQTFLRSEILRRIR